MRLNDLYNEEIDEFFFNCYFTWQCQSSTVVLTLQRVILEKVTVLQCST